MSSFFLFASIERQCSTADASGYFFLFILLVFFFCLFPTYAARRRLVHVDRNTAASRDVDCYLLLRTFVLSEMGSLVDRSRSSPTECLDRSQHKRLVFSMLASTVQHEKDQLLNRRRFHILSRSNLTNVIEYERR